MCVSLYVPSANFQLECQFSTWCSEKEIQMKNIGKFLVIAIFALGLSTPSITNAQFPNPFHKKAKTPVQEQTAPELAAAANENNPLAAAAAAAAQQKAMFAHPATSTAAPADIPATDLASVPEPELTWQVYLLEGRKLTALEKVIPTTKTELKFGGVAVVSTYAGRSSSVRTTANPVFEVKLVEGMNPASFISLTKLKQDKDSRKGNGNNLGPTVKGVGAMGALGTLFGKKIKVQSASNPDQTAAGSLDIKPAGGGKFLITVVGGLEKGGEYAINLANVNYPFGVEEKDVE